MDPSEWKHTAACPLEQMILPAPHFGALSTEGTANHIKYALRTP